MLSDWNALGDMCEECWNTAENNLRTPYEEYITCSTEPWARCTNARRFEIAINSGVDMIMMPYDFFNHMAEIESLVQSGQIAMSRIDEAVSRILKVKYEYDLFTTNKYPNIELQSDVHDESARNLARTASQKTSVVLLNEDNVLPIRSGSDITIACDGAKNKSRPLGGGVCNGKEPPTTSG